jgi:DNA topoisomerase IA
MPPKVLNVAEKPSVAKEISRILNGGHIPRGRDGGNNYCRIYDFPCQIRWVSGVMGWR